MKALLPIIALYAVTTAFAADKPAPLPDANAAVSGTVLEVKDVESYTYLRLKTAEGETWAAINKAPVKKGARVTIENPTVMNNFESKLLKQTFKTLVFGTLAGAHAGTDAAAKAAAHATAAKPAEPAEVRVAKATGPDARTVADIMTKATELKDKPVLLRGQVVKFNPGIMGKNWVHLRDGTGTASANTHDVLVTTMGETSVGSVITVRGIVRTDKDFGSGYAYKVMIEDAVLQK